MFKFVLFFTLAMSFNNLALAQQPLSFKGLTLGRDLSSTFDTNGVDCKSPVKESTTHICVYKPTVNSKFSTLAGVRVDYILFHTLNNKIVRLFVATAEPKESSYNLTVEALSEKYGLANEIKPGQTGSWDTAEYTYKDKNNYYVYKNVKSWSQQDSYMLYRNIGPAISAGHKSYPYISNDDIWELKHFGYEPYRKQHRSRFQFGLLLLDESAYLNAIKVNRSNINKAQADNKKQEESFAVDDL